MVKHVIKGAQDDERVCEWSLKIEGTQVVLYANDEIVLIADRGILNIWAGDAAIKTGLPVKVYKSGYHNVDVAD